MWQRLLNEEMRLALAHFMTKRRSASDWDSGSKSIRTAIIAAAGFGTRLYPASRSIRPKSLMPIIDADGFVKPLLLHLVEQCIDCGISQIVIVVGPGDQEERFRQVFYPVEKDLFNALKPGMRSYAERIASFAKHITIVVQRSPEGFGHAVTHAGPFLAP